MSIQRNNMHVYSTLQQQSQNSDDTRILPSSSMKVPDFPLSRSLEALFMLMTTYKTDPIDNVDVNTSTDEKFCNLWAFQRSSNV